MSLDILKVLGESPARSFSVDWKARFEIQLTKSDFDQVIKIINFEGKFTKGDMGYFWGFGPEQNAEGWVFRNDFYSGDLKIGTTYEVGGEGFSGLLIEGGGQMISGGRIHTGKMILDKYSPEQGVVKGRYLKVVTKGGRPDGSELDPAYASYINFECWGEPV